MSYNVKLGDEVVVLDDKGIETRTRVTQTTKHFVRLAEFSGMAFHRSTGRAKGNQGIEFKVPRSHHAPISMPQIEVASSESEDVLVLMELMGTLAMRLTHRPDLACEVAQALCEIVAKKTKKNS